MPDPLYVRARRALLDALFALEPHRDTLVLVGAQALYLHTGAAELAVAEFTTDADLALVPGELAGAPLLADLLRAHGFAPREHPGSWSSPDGIAVDLMVPESLAGPGRRGARLGAHGSRAARRAKGLEAALVDRARHTIGALDPSDGRSVEIWVAGPAALLVAKTHKIAERIGVTDRVRDKDALDVLRLLRAVSTADLARRLSNLRESAISATVSNEAVECLPLLFGSADAEGVQLAVRAVGGSEDPATITASLVTLLGDLLEALDGA